ncbi:1,4-dihydroxy-6-naphthoate synthase [Salidesulfovibrio onnuriiensis]|uniref:1,4-dihydroxy-6-naphthoate synthase n=1 Tax=Salidesulfovibrio onnuriiensis TaxID=2583823 RepID=UPI0011CC966E|nr:1,4-dihydroxy-6-naphthoate synthase [Salidesulfovibrio onnuriiensis]
MTKLTLGYSPCPNDTFIFYALAAGVVPAPAERLDVTLADVEELNQRAARGELDICKVSVAAAAEILDEYMLLGAGGALGRGVGPVLVSGRDCLLRDLHGTRIAIPGRRTTANLLFGLCCRQAGIEVELVEMVFDEVMPAIREGRVDAGVVIHEGRFTYESYGLCKLMDLGQWWEEFSGLPIPLGAIAVRRSLGVDTARAVEAAIRASLQYSWDNPGAPMNYIREHAQEMDEAVIAEHIRTFVTEYSMDVGEEGRGAVMALLQEAARMTGGNLPDKPVFVPCD